MGLLKCVSLLVCALCLAIPSCFGAVWTAEDEARALRQGKGRLSHTADGGQLQSQGDESLEQLQLQDRDKSLLQFDGREQFDGARAPHQGRGRFQQFNSQSKYRASQASQTSQTSQAFAGRTVGQNQAELRPHIDYRNSFNPNLDARQTGAQFPQYKGRVQGDATQYEGRRQGDAAQYEGRRQGDTTQYEGRVQGDAAQFQGRRQGDATQYEGRRQGDATQYEGRVQGDAALFQGRRQGDATHYEGRRQGDATQYEGRGQGDAAQFQGRRQDDAAQYEGRVEGDARQSEDRFILPAQFDGLVQGDARQYEDRFAETQFDGRTDENVEGADDSDDGDCISCRFIRKEDKKSEAAESGGGYVEETLKSFRGLFQGEQPAPAVELERNPEPVNPKFGVRPKEPFQDGRRPNLDYRNSFRPNLDARQQYSPLEFDGQTQNFFQQEYSSSQFRSQTSTFGEQPDPKNARFGEQIDEAKEDDSVETFNSEQEYLEHRLQQLNNPSDSTRLGGQPQDDSADPNFDGQTQNVDAKVQPIDPASDNQRLSSLQDGAEPVDTGLTKGQLEYLEYRRQQQLSQDLAHKEVVRFGQQSYDDSVRDVKPIQNDPTQDARFQGQPIQNDPTQDARFRGQQNQGGSNVEGNAELEYLEYRRTQQLYDNPAQDVQPVLNDPRLDDRSAQDVQPVLNDPIQDDRFREQQIQGGSNEGNAELEYLEYRRTQQLYEDPPRDVETKHVFDGRTPQAATQLDGDNLKNFGFEPLPSFGFQPLPSFGFQPVPQKTEAELAFVAEHARLRAAQEYRRTQQQYNDPSSANTRFGGQARDGTTAGVGGTSPYSDGRLDYSASSWQTGSQFYDFTPQSPSSSRFGGQTPDSDRRNFASHNEYDPAFGNNRHDGRDYSKNSLDADSQGIGILNLNNRLPYDASNVDQPASSNTRFGSQFQSATNTKFQSESNARFGGRTQDDSTKLDAPAFPTLDGFGGRTRGLGSEHPSRGFGEGYPASEFKSQTRHEVEYSQSEHVFDGRTPQAATQLDGDNLKNFGFEPLPSFGFQPLPSFGFEPVPQKTEAELAFETEQARLRAAQEAQEASLREAQEAFEEEIKRLKLRGCSSCHLVYQVAAFEEGNTELLDDLPVKVSKLMDVDESEQTVKSTLSRDGCVTCHLVNPPSPEPAPIVEGAAKAGHFKVPILVDDAGKAAPLQNSGSSAVLDLRKASSFRTSILMDSEDRPFIPAAPQREEPLVNERSFNDTPQRRLKATQVRPRERGCRSCHVVHG